jgi:Rieske Fe-S protein
MAGVGGLGEGVVNRRRFLAGGLAATLAAWTARLRAQGTALRFRPLARNVVMPLADLATPWRARPFVADAVTLPTAAKPNEPIRISGFVLRTAGEGDVQADQFRAVCVRCPHEHCDVDYIRDPATLPAEVLQEIGKPPKDPVYLCPCHNSTFSAHDGERLAGPAPRGLYQFRVTKVSDATVEIGEVEEDLLIFI